MKSRMIISLTVSLLSFYYLAYYRESLHLNKLLCIVSAIKQAKNQFIEQYCAFERKYFTQCFRCN